MKKFSERAGITKPKTEIQLNTMDSDLRNCLWNATSETYWEPNHYFTIQGTGYMNDDMLSFMKLFWDSYFKKPNDSVTTYNWNKIYGELRLYYFHCQWYEVYNFIEFCAQNYPNQISNARFIQTCNRVLERELSGYRFVGNQIAQITSKEEISEIEDALATPFKTVNIHISNALKLMSDKKNPDYRNSIKESISAVESICRIIAKNEKATLGNALDIIESKVKLHGALKRAFDSLYGYTSSAEGIRHSLLEEKTTLESEDAKFMLISCSAFVNFLISKASRLGISINSSVG